MTPLPLDDSYLDKLEALAGSSVGKTLGMTIRPALIAAPGRTLVWGDWSNIEARVLPWLAASPGAEETLQVFRDSDHDKSKPDVYVFNAAKLLGRDPQEMWDAYRNGEPWAKKGRQSHGKIPVLSLGFGGAAGALMKMAVNYHVHVDLEDAQAMVSDWRGRNQWAPDFWGTFRVDRHGNRMRGPGRGMSGSASGGIGKNPAQFFTFLRAKTFGNFSYFACKIMKIHVDSSMWCFQTGQT